MTVIIIISPPPKKNPTTQVAETPIDVRIIGDATVLDKEEIISAVTNAMTLPPGT